MSEFEILPGEIMEPDWPYLRCAECARSIGGDRTSGWATCVDVPKVHMTMENVPRDVRDKFYLERVWSNAFRFLGLVDAIKWMGKRPDAEGRSPLDLCELGEGDVALPLQYDPWPELVREAPIMRGGLKVA